MSSPFWWGHYSISPISLDISVMDLEDSRATSQCTVLSGIALTVSSFTLTVLAVERYHALLKLFSTGLRLKEDNIKQAIALIWISSVLLCLPFFFLKEWRETYSTCINGPVSLHVNQATKIYVIICFLLSTYLPVAVFSYCYGSLIKGLYSTNTYSLPRNKWRKKF